MNLTLMNDDLFLVIELVVRKSFLIHIETVHRFFDCDIGSNIEAIDIHITCEIVNRCIGAGAQNRYNL